MEKSSFNKAEDFILSESFIAYALHGEKNEWVDFTNENPSKKVEIEKATELAKVLYSSHKGKIDSEIKQRELERLIHKLNQKPKLIQLIRPLLKYAAAILVLISLVQIPQVKNHVLYKNYTAHNVKNQVILSDSTLVDLNKNSSLLVSRFYGMFNRDVKLKGEGFFNVKHNPELSFNIQAHNCKVQVLGTQFNVNTVPNKSEVSVKQGKVRFYSSESNSELILTKNMAAEFQSGKSIESKQFNVNNYGWKTGEFEFENTNLLDVFNYLSSYYNYSFSVDEKFHNKTVNIYITDMEFEEALKALNLIIPELQFEINNNTVTIY